MTFFKNTLKLTLGLALLLAFQPAKSGAAIGSGPCSMAWTLTSISGEHRHSFGETISGWYDQPEMERENSHYSWSYGAISSAQHPTCDSGGGDDDPGPVE